MEMEKPSVRLYTLMPAHFKCKVYHFILFLSAGYVTPPGAFFHIKMFMLMCLLLLCCSESSEEDEIVGHSKNLNFLIISEDLLLVQRLLLYGASFAKRMIVYSPMSELFASCSRDPFGFDTCMINGKRSLSMRGN